MKGGLREVGGGPVVEIHLFPLDVEGRVDEESGMSATGDGPDDVGWVAVIPDRDFRDDTGVFFFFS